MSLLDPQLQAFIQVAKTGTVHAAAEELCITQTATTQRLKNLEQKLNVSLFIRSRRGMLLTPEGEALLRYCQNVQALEGETLSQIQGVGKTKNVKVAITGPTSVLQARVLPVINTVMQQFPKILFEVLYRDSDEPIELLKKGKAHFAILPVEQVSKEMQCKTLRPEQYVLLSCKKWKSRKLAQILQQENIIDFEVNDKMTYAYLNHFNLFKHANNERHFANHPEAIAQLIANGRGYSVLEKSFAEPWIKSGKLIALNKSQYFKREICLAWYDRPTMPNYMQDIINLIL